MPMLFMTGDKQLIVKISTPSADHKNNAPPTADAKKGIDLDRLAGWPEVFLHCTVSLLTDPALGRIVHEIIAA